MTIIDDIETNRLNIEKNSLDIKQNQSAIDGLEKEVKVNIDDINTQLLSAEVRIMEVVSSNQELQDRLTQLEQTISNKYPRIMTSFGSFHSYSSNLLAYDCPADYPKSGTTSTYTAPLHYHVCAKKMTLDGITIYKTNLSGGGLYVRKTIGKYTDHLIHFNIDKDTTFKYFPINEEITVDSTDQISVLILSDMDTPGFGNTKVELYWKY